jgi:hypothetical protein
MEMYDKGYRRIEANGLGPAGFDVQSRLAHPAALPYCSA